MGSAAGGETRAALSRIEVVAPGRIGQQIRNDLVFGLIRRQESIARAGASTSPPRRSITAVGIDRSSNLASAYLDCGPAGCLLTEIATD